MVIKSFTDLEVWRLSKDLAVKVYTPTAELPPEERYGLRAQPRDSVVSISANIAEGFGRYHYKENIKFLYNARGSLQETKSHLLIADEIYGFKDQELYREILRDIERIGVKLNNLIASIGRRGH